MLTVTQPPEPHCHDAVAATLPIYAPAYACLPLLRANSPVSIWHFQSYRLITSHQISEPAQTVAPAPCTLHFFCWRKSEVTTQKQKTHVNTTTAASCNNPNLTEIHHNLRRGGNGSVASESSSDTSTKNVPNDLALQHAKIMRLLCNHTARTRVWNGTGIALTFALANWRKNA